MDESARAAHALDERSMSSLEKRRLEHELGAGGDHDVPYHFALPLSMPQALAWMRLMGRVQRGELQPLAVLPESKTRHIRIVDQFATLYQSYTGQ